MSRRTKRPLPQMYTFLLLTASQLLDTPMPVLPSMPKCRASRVGSFTVMDHQYCGALFDKQWSLTPRVRPNMSLLLSVSRRSKSSKTCFFISTSSLADHVPFTLIARPPWQSPTTAIPWEMYAIWQFVHISLAVTSLLATSNCDFSSVNIRSLTS